MIRMARNTPTAYAHFEVYVPVAGRNTEEDAARIVERYLYNGFVRGDIDYEHTEFDDGRYVVPVTYADHRVPNSGTALEQAKGAVETQRDRFASGMYVCSEPTYYLPVD